MTVHIRSTGSRSLLAVPIVGIVGAGFGREGNAEKGAVGIGSGTHFLTSL